MLSRSAKSASVPHRRIRPGGQSHMRNPACPGKGQADSVGSCPGADVAGVSPVPVQMWAGGTLSSSSIVSHAWKTPKEPTRTCRRLVGPCPPTSAPGLGSSLPPSALPLGPLWDVAASCLCVHIYLSIYLGVRKRAGSGRTSRSPEVFGPISIEPIPAAAAAPRARKRVSALRVHVRGCSGPFL